MAHLAPRSSWLLLRLQGSGGLLDARWLSATPNLDPAVRVRRGQHHHHAGAGPALLVVTRGGRWAASLDSVRFMTSCVRRRVECALRTVIPPWQHEDMVSPRRRLDDRRRRLAAGRSHEYENTRTREHENTRTFEFPPRCHTYTHTPRNVRPARASRSIAVTEPCRLYNRNSISSRYPERAGSVTMLHARWKAGIERWIERRADR